MTPTETAIFYAQDVVSGEIPAGRYVQLACQRFLTDLERTEWRYGYDPDAANDVAEWVQKLPHTKGRWAAKKEKLTLSPWQLFLVCNLFGFKNRDTGHRRFRESYCEVPRKNGKSLLAASIGLKMFLDKDDFGNEVYSGATTEQQAFEIFRPAKQICERLPKLREKYDIDVNAKSLSIVSSGARFQPLVGKPGDGASPSCALVDEFHEHADWSLVDTMVTGMGAREQPLLFIITTAGSDFGGPCYEKRQDVIRILEGTYEDDTVFGLIYTLDPDDRWDTEEALRKANPNFDVSVSGEFLRQQLEKAKRSAADQNAFKTKHLNLWVGARVSWVNMLELQLCKQPVKIEDFAGRECVLGVDLASKVDLASVCALFWEGDTYTAFWRHYLPETTVREAKVDRYPIWASAGQIVQTPGEIIDFDFIEEEIRRLSRAHRVLEVAYDPYQATQFATRMLNEGMPMVETRQTRVTFHEPMDNLNGCIRSRKFRYDGDPVSTWMFGNVVNKLDAGGRNYPDKERPENKIDGVIALLMAMSRARVLQEQNRSVGIAVW